jgi:hypothetical protein
VAVFAAEREEEARGGAKETVFIIEMSLAQMHENSNGFTDLSDTAAV